MNEHYEPKGIRFTGADGREYLYAEEGHWAGWLAYRHPDGQWVSLRKATPADLAALADHCRSREAYEGTEGNPREAAEWYLAELRVHAALYAAT